MTYRDGTYVSYHLGGTVPPFASESEFQTLLKSWTDKGDEAFAYVTNEMKDLAVTDARKRTALRQAAMKSLRNSKHLLLLVDETTHFDTTWVPFEIEQAVDHCEIPIIAAYLDYNYIIAPDQLRNLWPDALTKRIEDASARVIHVPFKMEPVVKALRTYHRKLQPRTGLSFFTKETYQKWGLIR